MIEVRDVGRALAAPPDVERLAERVQEAVAERIAHVRVVEAAGRPASAVSAASSSVVA